MAPLPVKILHLSDIHLGSGQAHGYTNPETGWNTRVEDFVLALRRCIDRAIAEPVDLVLFGGDAFPDATPPPYLAQAFAQEFGRLAAAQIPTVLLVGNHDLHSQGQGGASLAIYRSLAVPGFVVGDRLATHPIGTRQGVVQVVTLPWLTKSMLLTRPETEGLSLAEVNHLLLNKLRLALEGEIRQLDPALPTVLLAHVMTDTARFGAERFLAVGKGFTVPLTMLARPEFDYVALGHVHRFQQLSTHPPVVYPGSIERVDFSEAQEDKGYVLVQLAKQQASAEFCPLPVRPFRLIEVNLAAGTGRGKRANRQASPMERLIQALPASLIENAVVRVVYQIRPDQQGDINHQALHQALAGAHSYTIHPELVSHLSRPRLPELGLGSSLDPLEALQTYLNNRPDLQAIAPDLNLAAQALVEQAEAPLVWAAQGLNSNALDSLKAPPNSQIPIRQETQLRLL
jgi:DNA repair protein SbcD/Mre11